MGRPLCPECSVGAHSRCSGDFSPVSVVTCACEVCKAWLDAHGPFAAIPDSAEGKMRLERLGKEQT